MEARLGTGGFGAVYRGVQPLIGKQVAIKVLNGRLSADREMVSRFVSEARAVNQIRHKNIIDIFSFGALPDGRQYFVMEYLPGQPLSERIRERGRLAPDEALPILRGVTRALEAAHAAGIVHRDLKPDNVFVTDDDGQPFPKLLDFGIAKLVNQDKDHSTATGMVMGTPHYMSPEQCRGRGVDHRTDIYAFGVLAYETLTGKVPFTGSSAADILVEHLHSAPPPPSRDVPALGSRVDESILAMLEKQADARPQTIGAAFAALADALAGVQVERATPGAAATLPPDAPTRPPVDIASRPVPVPSAVTATPVPNGSPNRRWWLVGGVAAVAAIAVIAMKVAGGTPKRQAPPSVAPAPTPDAAPAIRVASVLTVGGCRRLDDKRPDKDDQLAHVRPSRSKDEILRFIKGRRGALSTCHALVKNRGGDLFLDFTIGADGHVSAAHASGFSEPTFERCVLDVVQAITFARANSEVVVKRLKLRLPEDLQSPRVDEDPVDTYVKTSLPSTLRQNSSSLGVCYDKALAQTPGLTGVIEAELWVDGGGVLAARTRGVPHAGMTTCLADAIKKLRFPAPPNGGDAKAVCVLAVATTAPPKGEFHEVDVHRDNVTVDGRSLGQIPFDGPIRLEPLADRLSELRRSNDRPQTIVLVPDGDIDVHGVFSAAYTAASAGYVDVRFAVRTPTGIEIVGGGDFRSLQPNVDVTRYLLMLVGPGSVVLRPKESGIELGPPSTGDATTIAVIESEPDLPALARALDERRAAGAFEFDPRIAVVGLPPLQWHTLATAMKQATMHGFPALQLLLTVP